MPQNITDGTSWVATVTAPASSDALDETEVLSMGQKLADRTRYLADRVGGTAGTSEWAYPSARARTIQISVHAANVGPTSKAVFATQKATLDDDSGSMWWDLSELLPDGCVVTAIDVYVDPGSARAGTNRMAAELKSVDLSAWTTVSEATEAGPAYDNAGTGKQTIALSSISETIARGSDINLILLLTAGNDADTNNDDVYGIKVSYNDPGPRN